MKREIKHGYSGAILYSAEIPQEDYWKLLVEKAVIEGANLEGANLAGAYLGGANLAGVNLRGANLAGAKGLDNFPIQVGGSRDWLITTQTGELKIGCHVHSFEYWLEHYKAIGRKEGYTTEQIEEYGLHIAHMQAVSKILWRGKEGQK